MSSKEQKKEPIVVAQIMGKWVGGGVEAVIMNYYRHIDRTKIQFDFICDEDSTNIPYEEIEKLGGKVILCPPYQKLHKYMKFLKNLFREKKYRIVHSNINTLSVFPLKAAKKAGVPVRIAHSHSTSNPKEWKKNLLKNTLRPFSKKNATDYFACSEHAGRYLFGNRTFDAGKVTIIPNAIDIDKFKFNPTARKKLREEIGLKDDDFIIGHVGRFVEQKNHTFLVDVFAEVKKQRENAKLVLVGQGPLREEIEEKVKKLGLEKDVFFLGQRSDTNKLYSVFDVFCLPSLYEGLPVVGVEAQANGLSCMFSDNISSEVIVCDNSCRIENSINTWARAIVDTGINRIKNNGNDKRLDIMQSSKILSELYVGDLTIIPKANNEMISVIVPVYNTPEEMLDKCLCSLKNQTYEKMEIIVVDDGSTDVSTIKKCDSYANENRFHVYHKKNGGLCSARNYGYKKARGAWITFVDGDDYLNEDCLTSVFLERQDDSADIVCFGTVKEYRHKKFKYDFSGYLKKGIKYNNNEQLIEKLFDFKSNIGDVTAKLYSKRFLMDNGITHNENVKQGIEAIIFNYDCFNACTSLEFVEVYGYNYSYNPNSITLTIDEDKIDCLEKGIDTLYFRVAENGQKKFQEAFDYRVKYVVAATAIGGIFSPNHKRKYKEKKKMMNGFLQNKNIKKAISTNNKGMDVTRRVTLFNLRHHVYIPVAAISALRNIQKRLLP